MESSEVLASIDCFNAGVNCPWTLDQVCHALHDNPSVRDVIWHHLDHDLFQINSLEVIADHIGDIALNTIENPTDRRQWMGAHGFGELYFFSAWMLYRQGRLDIASQACINALGYLPGDHATTKLLALIGMEQDEPAELPFNHSTLSKVSLDKDARVVWPSETDEFNAASFQVKVDDRWTR